MSVVVFYSHIHIFALYRRSYYLYQASVGTEWILGPEIYNPQDPRRTRPCPVIQLLEDGLEGVKRIKIRDG